MAALFGQFVATTMSLIEKISRMHGIMTDDSMSDEMKEFVERITSMQENAFKKALKPHIDQLLALELEMRKRMPKKPGELIVPGDPEFPT